MVMIHKINEDQVELEPNIVESYNDENDDDFDNENDAYQASLDTQRRDRRARL